MRVLMLLVVVVVAVGACSTEPPGEQEPTTTEAPCTCAPKTTPAPPSSCSIPAIASCPLRRQQTEAVDCKNAGKGLEMKRLSFGTYYHESYELLSWCEAHQFCLDHNLVLAHPVNRTMKGELKDVFRYVDESWVGAHSLDAPQGEYRWVDGKLVNDVLWYSVKDKECAAMSYKLYAKVLQSYDCNIRRRNTLCQVPTCCRTK